MPPSSQDEGRFPRRAGHREHERPARRIADVVMLSRTMVDGLATTPDRPALEPKKLAEQDRMIGEADRPAAQEREQARVDRRLG
jgi:hypothetical protein